MLALPHLLGVSGHWLLTGEGEAVNAPIPAEAAAYREIVEIVCRVSGCATPPSSDASPAERNAMELGRATAAGRERKRKRDAS
jgi:hypothetical protein